MKNTLKPTKTMEMTRKKKEKVKAKEIRKKRIAQIKKTRKRMGLEKPKRKSRAFVSFSKYNNNKKRLASIERHFAVGRCRNLTLSTNQDKNIGFLRKR